jgi:hypothetical protein
MGTDYPEDLLARWKPSGKSSLMISRAGTPVPGSSFASPRLSGHSGGESQNRPCARVLAAVEERIGLAPGYAYEVLLDLARPWTMPLNLVYGQGNYGSRGSHPAANFRYTEARISPAGQVALAAEHGDLAPVPIGLINGNVYREGTRPPFRPQGVIEAIREVVQRP